MLSGTLSLNPDSGRGCVVKIGPSLMVGGVALVVSGFHHAKKKMIRKGGREQRGGPKTSGGERGFQFPETTKCLRHRSMRQKNAKKKKRRFKHTVQREQVKRSHALSPFGRKENIREKGKTSLGEKKKGVINRLGNCWKTQLFCFGEQGKRRP